VAKLQCQRAKRMLGTGLGSYSGSACHFLNGLGFLMVAAFILHAAKTKKESMRGKKVLIEWYTVIFVQGILEVHFVLVRVCERLSDGDT